jgi:hypothetical protein
MPIRGARPPVAPADRSPGITALNETAHSRTFQNRRRGEDFLFFVGDTGPMLDVIEEFLTGELPARHSPTGPARRLSAIDQDGS